MTTTSREPFQYSLDADGNDLKPSEMLGQAMGAISMCWIPTPTGVFDSERAVEIVTKVTEDLHLDEPMIVHNESTLYVVNDALKRAGLDEQQTRDAINSMQNAGILFRERARDSVS